MSEQVLTITHHYICYSYFEFAKYFEEIFIGARIICLKRINIWSINTPRVFCFRYYQIDLLL